jgi:hypothetical protein
MERTERFTLTMSQAEKSALVCLAERQGGLSQAATVRWLVRRAARRLGLWPPEQQQGTDLEETARIDEEYQ